MTTVFAPQVRTAEQFERTMPLPPALRSWFHGGGRIPLLCMPTAPVAHIPETSTTLVLRHEVSGRRDVVVIGPYTRASYKAAATAASCLRLRLIPGSMPGLLGVSAAELADRVLPLAEFPGPLGTFAERLLNSPATAALPMLATGLPPLLTDDPAAKARRELLRAALTALSGAPASIPQVAARLAVSERQLRLLFSAGVGVSPKHVARIGRVRRVLSGNERGPLARIAADHGYYDQSHFAADFRALMGTSPIRFFQGRLPAPTPCHTVIGSTRSKRSPADHGASRKPSRARIRPADAET